ncbi:MAG: PKD domain-containing protein [Bacteroidia bacterium]
MTINFDHAPYANAGSNQTVCANNANVSLNGSINSYATGATWTTSGSGSFSPNATTLNATYIPSNADTTAGGVTLTLTTTGNGQCHAASSIMHVTITHAPTVNPGSNVSACKNNADISLHGTSSTGTGTWTTSGTGTFSPNSNTLNATYITSSADTAAGSVTLTLTSDNNGTCTAVNKSITVTYTPIPKVRAGSNVTVCANNASVSLNGTSSTGSGSWSTSGTGTFTPNNATLNATYIPSNADTTAGSVTLTLASTNNNGCLSVSSSMTVNFTHAPADDAGSNASACANNANVTLNGSFNSYATGAIWTTSGTGTFSPDATAMNATYISSPADTAAHNVTLTLTTTGNGQCNAAASSMTIAYTSSPDVKAGSNTKVCLSSPDYTLNGYSSTTKGIWSTLGSGTFSPINTDLNATYIPGTADTAAKTATLILTSTNNGGCNPVSDTIVLTYTKTPVVTAGSNQTVCANNDIIPLNGTSSTGTGIWTTSGSGTFTPSNTNLNATYIPSNADTGAGGATLTLTATGGCSPVASSIAITITHAPFADAGPDQSVCRNNANVTLNGYIGGATTTGVWSSSGTGIFTPGNTTLNATYVPSSADTTAGKVDIVLTSTGNGSCLAVSDTMVITYSKMPSVSAGSGVTVCANNDSVKLNGFSSTGSGQWSTSGSGTFYPNNDSLDATYIPSNADTGAGSVTLTLTSANNGGCSPVNGQMVITINHAPVANAGPDQSVCANNADVSLAGIVTTASGGQWSTSGSGTFSPNNTTLNATYIPSNADTTAGIVNLILTTTGNGLCKVVRDTMVVTITPAPRVSAGSNKTVCVTSPDVALSGTSSTGSAQWSTLGDGSFSPNNTTLNATYTPGTADTATGSVKLVLTSANNNNCDAVSDTVVIKYAKPPKDNAGSNVTVCANNDSISLHGLSTTGSGVWSTSGNGAFSPNSNILNAIYIPGNTDTASGSVLLTLTTTNNGSCTAATSQLTATITPAPTANAGPGQSICANTTVSLSGSVNSVASGGQWSTLGSGIFSPNNTTLNATYIPSVADTAAHKAILILTTTGNGLCKAATDTMIVTINQGPTVNAGGNASVCLSSPDYKLNGFSSTGSGTWTTLGSGSFSPNPNTLNATYIPGSADTSAKKVKLVLASTNNGSCSVSSDTIVLTYTNTPTVDAGSNQSVCGNNATVSLNGSSSTGSGVWSTSGSGTFSPDNSAMNAVYTPSSSDTAAGTVTLTLTATRGCSPVAQSITITITPAPFAYAGGNQSVCKNNSNVTLNGYVGGGASTGIWTTSGTGTFSPGASALNATYTAGSADTAAGKVTLVLTTTNNGDCIAATDTMVITYTAPPKANAGSNATACANNFVSLNGTITGGSGTGIWTTTNGSGSFSPNNTALNASYLVSNADTLVKNVVLVLTSTNNGGCLASSDSIVITVTPGPIVNAGGGQVVCSNNPDVTLSGSITHAAGGVWTTIGSGTFSPNDSVLNATYMPSSSDVSAGSVKLVLASTGNGLCNTATDTMVVTFSPSPLVNAGGNVFICTGSTSASLNGKITGGASTGVWTTLGSGTFSPNDSALNATYNLSSADTTAKSVILVLTSTHNGDCLAVSDTINVRITPVPTANAGADTTVCASSDSIPLHGVITGGSGTGKWSTLGSGTFTPGDSVLNATYSPSSSDTAAHSVRLVLTTTNSCLPVSDTMEIFFNPLPIASAGANQAVCSNNPDVSLSGNVTHATGGMWTTMGSGTFSPNDSTLNATYIASSSDVSSGSVKLVLASTGNGLCSTATDTVVVTFSPSPVVNAGGNISICTGETNASLNGKITGGSSTGQWTTLGSGTFSPDDSALNATYNLSSADTAAKSVILVLTSTHNGGCLAVSDTITIKITPVPTAYAGADTAVCASSDSVALHGKITGGSGTGKWSTLGTGTFIPDDSVLNATYIPGSADTAAHSVKLVLTTTNSCMPVSDTMVISFNSLPIVNAGPGQTVCSNNPDVSLSGSVTHATGGVWATMGTGTFTPNDSALNATYIPGSADVSSGSVKLVLASTGNGLCTTASDTMVVTFSPSPVVNGGGNIFICTGTTSASLNGNISGGSSTGKWTTLGSGTFSPNDSALNATYNLSSADTAAKTVILVLTSTHNGGCLAASDTIIIKITPVSTAYAGADTTVCASTANIPLHGVITGGSGTGKWSTLGSGTFTPDDSALNATYTPSSADTSADSVKLVLTTTNTCLPVSDTMVIFFNPLPVANAGSAQPVCAGNRISLNGSISHATGGNWTTLGNGIFTPNSSTLVATYVPGSADIDTGGVTVILTTTGNGGCSAATDSLKITILPKPAANFASSTACVSTTVNFTDMSTVKPGTITSWKWSFSNGTSTVQNPVDTFSSTGSQPVTLIVASDSGCSDTIVKSIYVNPAPVAMFNYNVACHDSVLFTDASSVSPGGIISWAWQFGDLDSSESENPEHTYPASGNYFVTLTVTSDSGCIAQHTDTLIVQPCNNPGPTTPAVPTAFTPNNSINNVLYVRGGPFTVFDFRVFNEWGNEVFHAVSQSSGWDGKKSGIPQPEGPYVWTLTGMTVDGTYIKMTGDVTLMK